MRQLNIYTFHKGIEAERFDSNNTKQLINELGKRYKILWYDLNGSDGFVYDNNCRVPITQGSITIFEFNDTKEFRVFDFGDAPLLTVQLSKSKNFKGAAIGQYNPKLWDEQDLPTEIRNKVVASIYPETYWHFGVINYEDVSNFRNSIDLDSRLYWRGSIYKNPSVPEYERRLSVEIINKYMTSEFYFKNYPIPFTSYIQEAIQFKLALCFGVGGGYVCGDLCFRDIEMYGLGIPVLRPRYATELHNPLIPDHHYISVDCEFDETYKYKNPEKLAQNIIKKYREVINDQDYLNKVTNNARNWYIENVTTPGITNIIISTLNL